MESYNIAILLAAGKGTRMNSTIPKQFLEIQGKSLIQRNIDTFSSVPKISLIILVLPKEYINKAQDLYKQNNIVIIPGGNERYESSYAALKYIVERHENKLDNIRIIIHDVARPFVSKLLINQSISGLDNYIAVNTVIPATDTILESQGGVSSQDSKYLKRSLLYHVQTPQSFRMKEIWDAYNVAILDMKNQKSLQFTDDVSILEKYSCHKAFLSAGCNSNIKITYSKDLK